MITFFNHCFPVSQVEPCSTFAAALCVTTALSMLVLDSNKNRKSKYWLCLLRCMAALRQERLSSTARESHPSASLPSAVSSRGSCLFLSGRFEERLPPEAPVGKSVTATLRWRGLTRSEGAGRWVEEVVGGFESSHRETRRRERRCVTGQESSSHAA